MVDGIRNCSDDPVCVCVVTDSIVCGDGEASWEVDGEIYCVDPNVITLSEIINGQRRIKAERERARKAWEVMPDAVKFLNDKLPIRAEYNYSEYVYATEKTVTFHFKDGSSMDIFWTDYKEYPFLRRGFEKVFPSVRVSNGRSQHKIGISPADFKKLNDHNY